jgi:hypothetical protein
VHPVRALCESHPSRIFAGRWEGAPVLRRRRSGRRRRRCRPTVCGPCRAAARPNDPRHGARSGTRRLRL